MNKLFIHTFHTYHHLGGGGGSITPEQGLYLLLAIVLFFYYAIVIMDRGFGFSSRNEFLINLIPFKMWIVNFIKLFKNE